MSDLKSVPPHHTHAIMLAIAANFGWAVMSITIKWLTLRGYPTLEITFFNGLVSFCCLAGWISLRGEWLRLKTSNPVVMGTYVLFSVGAGLCFFRAFGTGKLADVNIVFASGPFMVALLSSLFLKEHLSRSQLLTILTGFLGIMLVMRPQPDMSMYMPLLIIFVGTLLLSVSQILVRKCRGSISSFVFTFYFCTGFIIVSGLLMTYVPVRGADVPVFLLSGLCDVICLNLLYTSFRYASVSVLAPFQYSQILWCGVMGYLIWHEMPDIWSALGGVIVICSGIAFTRNILGDKNVTA